MGDNKYTPEPWRSITSPGQVKPGDKLHFTIGDKRYLETAKLILNKGTDREEIIYNKGKNYYLITSMCMANKGSQKNVKFLSVETVDSVKKQRDELLAALEKIMEEVGRKVLVEEDCGGAFDIEIWPDGLAAFVAARAAIASVKGEQ